MTEIDFEVSDRITKIRSINDMYDLEKKCFRFFLFLSFSGGKDSVVLSKLIDEALLTTLFLEYSSIQE